MPDQRIRSAYVVERDDLELRFTVGQGGCTAITLSNDGKQLDIWSDDVLVSTYNPRDLKAAHLTEDR